MLERAAAVPRINLANTVAWLAERRAIVVWWGAARALVLCTALALHWIREPRGYFGPTAFRHPFGVLETWDGHWYRAIAAHGYVLVPGVQSDAAFFPLYPLLLKLLSLTGLPVGAAGILLSNVAFLGALLVFDALGRALFGGELARRAVLLLAVFPLSYVSSMIYPESLLLLALSLAGLFLVRGRWWPCAVAAAVAALLRPEGALIVLPIAGVVIGRWSALEPRERGRAVAASLSGPAAAIAFPLYLGWSLHDPLAWSRAQHAWGRAFRPDGVLLAGVRAWHTLGGQVWPARDVAFCILTLVLLAAAWRAGAPRGWILLGLLLVVLPLASGSFESDARFGFVALPAYWGLAAACRGRKAFAATVVVSILLLVTATATLPLVFP